MDLENSHVITFLRVAARQWDFGVRTKVHILNVLKDYPILISWRQRWGPTPVRFDVSEGERKGTRGRDGVGRNEGGGRNIYSSKWRHLGRGIYSYWVSKGRHLGRQAVWRCPHRELLQTDSDVRKGKGGYNVIRKGRTGRTHGHARRESEQNKHIAWVTLLCSQLRFIIDVGEEVWNGGRM